MATRDSLRAGPRAGTLVLAWLFVTGAGACSAGAPELWTPEEKRTLRSLWIGSLGPLPPDPSNRVADDPQAAAFGRALFFDARLSANGKVACATCHVPERAFQDGLPLGRGTGTTARRTMSIAGTAYAPFLFWDGRKDSQWSQALEPFESAEEHGTTRTELVRAVNAHHHAAYQAVFGPLPQLSARRLTGRASPRGDDAARAACDAMDPADREAVSRVFANLGKAIAAFERLVAGRSGRNRLAGLLSGGGAYSPW